MAGVGPSLTLDGLRDAAVTFALTSWTWATPGWTMGPITYLQLNPGLANGCPALRNYCEGYKRLRPHGEISSRTFFAWHGTNTLANVASICDRVFNPTKRNRQVFGTGEYFGVVPEDSHNYTKNTDRLIVVQIIRSDKVRTRQGCHIVNNPIKHEYCFTLSVLVVTYNNKVPLAIPWIKSSRKPIPAPFMASQPPSGGAGPHTWRWTADAATMEPYGPCMNATLEHHYQLYLSEGLLAFLTALSQNEGQQYMFNFCNMTQQNMNTGFKRRIDRIDTTQNSSPVFWFWRNDDGMWALFSYNTSLAIEQRFNRNMAGCTVKVRRNPNVPKTYCINFTTMTQTNLATGYQRKVRRGPLGDAQSQTVIPVPSTAQQPRPGTSSINAGATDITPLLGSKQDKPGVAFVRKWFCCFC